METSALDVMRCFLGRYVGHLTYHGNPSDAIGKHTFWELMPSERYLSMYPLSMNPQHPTELTEAEEKIMAIAVRLDSAMRYRNRHLNEVNEEQYVHCIGTELVRRPAARIDGTTNAL